MPDAGFKIVQVTRTKDYDDGFSCSERRYAIADASGTIVDDAQGFGYKSFGAANKAMWYKFKGGRGKIESAKIAATKYWRDKKGIVRDIMGAMECNFKELARGEISDEEIISDVEKKHGVTLDRRMVDWLLRNS
jgi:hypothetical protein